ncbi:glycosyltransferase, partial [Patescibacteria group bacterium]|nr:glycosyltransferase [Patescibacteria group bacterium]
IKNLSKQGWKPDIIHANIHSAGLPSVILGKWFKVPVVITIHSSAFPRQLLAKIDKMLARIALNRVKLILPVSNRLLQSLKTYGIKNKFIILPNTYNPEIFYQQKTTNQFLNTKKILMVASLIPIKGIPYVLDAISKLKVKRTDFELDIISDGSYKTEYINLVKKYKIEKLVRFLGHKNKFEVADYMRKCQFFVLCSLWENLPCVLIEAMACGKPILATDVGGINELVNDNQGILIPSKDAKELERKIDFFLDNYQNYSAEKISKYASDNYSYNVIGKKLDGIYQQIMRENR